RACRELGVVVLAYSPLAQGRLTGKYSTSRPPLGVRRFSDYPMTAVAPVIDALRRAGERYQKTQAQVALNWIICKGAVPIPGAKNREQAEQNAGTLGWELEPEDVAALDRVALSGRRTLFHRLWQHG
ncbi:MAG: aldo/keto reductase, partial [Candidatus Binatia bacterium]